MIDVFNSPSCCIGGVGETFGEAHLRAFIVKVLNDLIDFFNVGKTMGAYQVAQTADLIIDEYSLLKPDDLKLCFNNAKAGKYGKVYDRIDGQVIMEWLRVYRTERCNIAEESSIQESEKFKNDPYRRTSETLSEAHHQFRKYDFNRKFKV
ncbi:MAG: hypothetical protein LBV32_10925 [Tannerellaceae bacterium]|nr:hypothetical protein [Tannerellaceae bacterium]